jgi:predicted outer membrane lipoprotein
MRVVTAAALFCAVVSAAFAQSDNSEKPSLSVNEVFGGFGFTMSTSIEPSCRVIGTIDKQTFLQKVPLLQTMGMLNPDLTKADINIKPTVLAAAFAILTAITSDKRDYRSLHMSAFDHLVDTARELSRT